MTELIDLKSSFVTEDTGSDIVLKTTQEIPQSFLDALAVQRADSLHTPSGEFVLAASIPVAVVEEMTRAGLDIYRTPIREIMAWLRRKDLQKFLATEKQL